MNSERPDKDGGAAPPEVSDAAGAAPVDGPSGDAPVTDGPRPARRPRGAVVACVAAAVLLAGGGGAYLASASARSGQSGGGSTATGPGSAGEGTPPPLLLDDRPAPGTGGVGIAPGEPDPSGVRYRASGPLPEGPRTAPVYRAEGEVGAADVARLAKALGVTDPPVERGGTWKAGRVDGGSGAVLTVERAAPGTWTFQRYAAGSDDCRKGTACPAPSGGTPVGEAAARKAAAPVLKALGLETARLDAGQVTGAQRAVNAEPVVDGLPTRGWTTGVLVGPGGEVSGGAGRMAAPVKGDAYPVLDAARTLESLNAPGAGAAGGIGGCASAVPLDGVERVPGDSLAAPCDAGPRTAVEPPTASVEEAVFGLAAHPVRGRPVLVPSWLFEVRRPGAKSTETVTHPAVDPVYLAPATTPAPSEGSATREVEVSGYRTEGRELTVYFTGGVCSSYSASAEAGKNEVTVTVTERQEPGKVCILVAREYERTVRLDEPLGTRSVLAPDGTPVPMHKPGARLPDAR
ncbi:hypothetical protein [Streptomyces tagetis]|uniref:Large membrane protein n=1 Tax=Streptomyces tagetis TaxID=2820809 RepID=A0A940XMW6_9ACTN|nr:hypothetical protein [Streptomyces sp. RG38]MBQ0830012.1 hypothetical protein [Streptomyces sp. RG38]